jgi:transcriptional regulator with XRE-family HTH domain
MNALKLRTARIDKNLSQRQLSYILGVSQPALSYIERGVIQANDDIREIAEDLLGPVDWKRTYSQGGNQRQILNN